MLVKLGSCNNCGLCCKRPCIDAISVISEKEDRCRFYVDTLNTYTYGHCLIYGRGAKPIETVKDRLGNKITQEQIDWFYSNCVDYPNTKDTEVWSSFSGMYPPLSCGFQFEVVS